MSAGVEWRQIGYVERCILFLEEKSRTLIFYPSGNCVILKLIKDILKNTEIIIISGKLSINVIYPSNILSSPSLLKPGFFAVFFLVPPFFLAKKKSKLFFATTRQNLSYRNNAAKDSVMLVAMKYLQKEQLVL
jgi:hypothetical protein